MKCDWEGREEKWERGRTRFEEKEVISEVEKNLMERQGCERRGQADV